MRHEGFARRTASIDASRSGAPTELTIDFAPSAGPLVVHLVDEGHVPIAGGFVRVVRAADHEAIMVDGSDATDEHGECRLRGVPAGELLVVVSKPGFAAASAKVTAGEEGETPVDVMMAKGYEVTVDAHHADGRAAEDGQISITDESGVPLYDHFDLAHAGPTRLFHAKFRLTDGTYTVRCLIPGGEGGSTRFVAAPGAIVDVALAPVH
jgi:hypothetical protein